MTSNEMAWKSRAEAAFTPLRSIHASWLPDALRQNSRLLDAAMLGASTRRLLYGHVAKVFMPVGGQEIDMPEWAPVDPAAQRGFVLRLGAFACADPLRRTIERAELADVHRAIDDETYCGALEQDVALVQNDLFAAYRESLATGDVGHFIPAMGLSVLLSVVPQDGAFTERRLRYYFSRKAWALRQPHLTCNRDRFIEILGEAGNG